MDPVFPENDDWASSGAKFSSYEQECIDFIEASMPNINESECENERLNYERKLWTYFQSSAMAIAQLYSRDNLSTAHKVWNTFQQASTNVTCLYKESTEYHKKNYDLYQQIGYHKRTKEILNWIKKKKNLIRREELLAFLGGHRDGTYLHNNCYYHRFGRNSRTNRNNNSDDIQRYGLTNPSSNCRNNNRFILSDTYKTNESDDLSSINNNNNNETNLEAIVSNIRNSTVLIANTTNKRNSWNLDQDLNELVDPQCHGGHGIVESRKRTSSMDICMDSPNNNKRTKFC